MPMFKMDMFDENFSCEEGVYEANAVIQACSGKTHHQTIRLSAGGESR